MASQKVKATKKKVVKVRKPMRAKKAVKTKKAGKPVEADALVPFDIETIPPDEIPMAAPGESGEAAIAPTVPSDRLIRCLQTGSLVALIPIIKTWDKSELEALLVDIDTYFKATLDKIAEKAEQLAEILKDIPDAPEIPPAIIAAQARVSLQLLSCCVEISSVASYYLGGDHPINEELLDLIAGKAAQE